MKPGSALPYEQAKKIIQRLNIPDQNTFYQLSKQRKLPKSIHRKPGKKYKDEGWIGFPDFLGDEDLEWTSNPNFELHLYICKVENTIMGGEHKVQHFYCY